MKCLNDIRIVGVRRARRFSPNNVGNDAAIIGEVMERLGTEYDVRVIDEEDPEAFVLKPGEDVIVHMCRESSSLLKLKEYENEGRLVINPVQGVENCARGKMIRIFKEKSIPQPLSFALNRNDGIFRILEDHGLNKFWIKRGDGQSLTKDDVACCNGLPEAKKVLDLYEKKYIKEIVISQHIEGDLIKFYGVKGQPFFYWFYPEETGYDKFGGGDPEFNRQPNRYKFDENALREICRGAAEALGVSIYGGDCIISQEGEIRLIDFNDWPSFSPCRDEAAHYIAESVRAEIKAKR